jgi:hypothetical protein
VWCMHHRGPWQSDGPMYHAEISVVLPFIYHKRGYYTICCSSVFEKLTYPVSLISSNKFTCLCVPDLIW